MRNKFLVTGATGFIGSNLVRKLVQDGEDVSIITREKKLNWRLYDISSKLRTYNADLTDFENLRKVTKKIRPDIIFHLAAYGTRPNQKEMDQLIDTNIKGTVNLINTVKKNGFKLFVQGSSSSEYGIKNFSMKEEDILEPMDDYGVTKSAATLFCQEISKKENLPITIFRLFSPYGYYEDKMRLIPYVILNALLEKEIELSNPKNVRDFIFIEDVVDAFIKTANNRKSLQGQIFNIGMGKQHTIKDVVDSIIKISDSRLKISWNIKLQKRFVQEPKVWQADIRKAKKILNWHPKYDLLTGLEKTFSWFKKNLEFYEK